MLHIAGRRAVQPSALAPLRGRQLELCAHNRGSHRKNTEVTAFYIFLYAGSSKLHALLSHQHAFTVRFAADQLPTASSARTASN